MARHISDLGVKALRPRGQRYEKSAGNGLFVVVQPSGAKSYALRFRINGRTRKLTLPGGLTLAAARKAAADALYEVEQGRDPALARQQQKQAQRLVDADTLAAVTAEFFRRESRGLRSAKRRRSVLDRLVIPTLGDRPIGDIKRSEIVRLLDRIEEANGPVMATDTLAYLRRIMNWHATRSDDFRSPIIRGMRRSPAASRERVLGDDEIRVIWTLAAQYGAYGAFLKVALLTAQRRAKLQALCWDQIDSNGVWHIPRQPREKTSAGILKLSPSVLEIMRSQPRLVSDSRIFRRPNDRTIASFRQATGLPHWTIHDLRRTARSLMSRAGVQTEISELVLGHSIRGIQRVYDRHSYFEEKGQALAKLAALIERILNPPAASIVSFGAA